MADQTASIRIQILGGIRAAREARTVAEAFDSLGDEITRTERSAIRAAFALKWLSRQMRRAHGSAIGMRLGMLRLNASLTVTSVLSWGLASVALPALALALWNVTAAVGTLAIALGGGLIALLGAAGLMALGTIDRFKQMSGVVGSAAYDLQNAGYAVRGAFRDATAGGADALMRGLARGMDKLVPLLHELTPAFTAMGEAMGSAFDRLFGQIGGMGPQINAMFMQMVPVVHAGADMLGQFLELLVQIGTVGAPLVADAFQWLDRTMSGWTASFTNGKLDSAKQVLRDFGTGVREFFSAFAKPIKPIFGDTMRDFADAWKTIGPNLGTSLGTIAMALMTIGRTALPAIEKGAQWLAQNLPSILSWLGDTATKLWEAVKPLEPFFSNILWPLIKGLGAGLGLTLGAAIKLIGTLSRGIGWLSEKLGFLKPVIEAIGFAFPAMTAVILEGANAVLGVVKSIKDALVDVFNYLKDLPGKAVNAVKGLPGWIGGKLGLTTVAGHAGGGTMTSGGLSWVGERGPELVGLPKGSTVFNSAQSRAVAASDRPAAAPTRSAPNVLHATFQAVMADGRVLAEAVREFNLSEALLEG